MKNKTDGSGITVKRKVKMRGIHTPTVVMFILGFIHGKRKLVKVGSNGLCSPYIIKKEKDFHEYLAKLYQVTLQYMKKIKLEKLHTAEKIFEIEQALENISKANIEVEIMGDDITQCRAREAMDKQRQQLQCKKMELLAELSNADEAMVIAETETKEIMISCKRRMEGKIMVYVEGAGFTEAEHYELSEDPFVIETYREYIDHLYLYETVLEGRDYYVISLDKGKEK